MRVSPYHGVFQASAGLGVIPLDQREGDGGP